MKFEDLNYTFDKIKPAVLVSGDKEMDDFFLKLAIFFNDIKSCWTLIRIFQEQNRSNELNLNSLNGEYGGMISMLEKNMISFLDEFFNLINKNKDIVCSFKFKTVIKEINKNPKIEKFWKYFLSLSLRKDLSSEDRQMRNILSEIRDNSFHYYNDITKYYREFFLVEDKDKKMYNEHACYSFGFSLINTRFFYADAAMQQNIKSHLRKIQDIKSESFLLNNTRDLLETVRFLLECYFKNIKQQNKK